MTTNQSNLTYHFNNQSITLTYGDCAENHRNMQVIGQLSDHGFSYDDLYQIKIDLANTPYDPTLIHLNQYLPHNIRSNQELYSNIDTAYVLVIPNGVDMLLTKTETETKTKSIANDLFLEQANLEWDVKAFMYGRVVNKKARYNLCYSDLAQEPDYKNGQGRIYAFDSVSLTKHIRNKLGSLIKSGAANNLQCEGNYYYDNSKCGISYHGDTERKKVIAIKLGDVQPIYYQWYIKSKPIGPKIKINLAHGDIYIMSEKATGYDWKKSSIYTLRHATGCDKFIN